MEKFFRFWADNRTKVLGYANATAGFISTTIAAGSFMDLLEPSTVKWLGILCGFFITVVAGGTIAVGNANTSNVRVAEAKAQVATAIQTALNTPPPGETTVKTTVTTTETGPT